MLVILNWITIQSIILYSILFNYICSVHIGETSNKLGRVTIQSTTTVGLEVGFQQITPSNISHSCRWFPKILLAVTNLAILERLSMTFTANGKRLPHVTRLPFAFLYLSFAYTRKRLETSKQLATISNMAAKRR